MEKQDRINLERRGLVGSKLLLKKNYLALPAHFVREEFFLPALIMSANRILPARSPSANHILPAPIVSAKLLLLFLSRYLPLEFGCGVSLKCHLFLCARLVLSNIASAFHFQDLTGGN